MTKEAIIRLDRAGLAAALALSREEGWNHDERDWARLVSLEPEGCFALEHEGVVVATTTIVCYGTALAWIGMVVTHPQFRGRGFARRLMERALDFARRRGIASIKLDSTDQGHPLYRALGFEDECAIRRWLRPAAAPGPPPPPVEPFRFDPAVDARAFGADRRRLLEALACDGEGASVRGGYALGRAGTKNRHFGPCVADHGDAARTLAAWFVGSHPGEAVSWDIVSTNAAAERVAREVGFEPSRTLTRMVRGGDPRGGPLVRDDGRVFAGAGFEYG